MQTRYRCQVGSTVSYRGIASSDFRPEISRPDWAVSCLQESLRLNPDVIRDHLILLNSA